VVLAAVHVLAHVLAVGAPVRAAQVQLGWEDPNNPAAVGGYILYYWQSTWDTAESIDVGNRTSYTLTGLEDGQTYHIVVTVYSADEGEESDYSEEIEVAVSEDSSASPPSPASDLIVIEAEAMTLTGYHIQENADASDGQLISQADASGSPGQATAVFPGPAGTYEVVVAYFDENDGESTLEAIIDGVVVDTWVADAKLPASFAGAATLAYRVVAPKITLAPGQVIALQGTRHGGEDAMIDRMEFIVVP
jgi:hypothetical protein